MIKNVETVFLRLQEIQFYSDQHAKRFKSMISDTNSDDKSKIKLIINDDKTKIHCSKNYNRMFLFIN